MSRDKENLHRAKAGSPSAWNQVSPRRCHGEKPPRKRTQGQTPQPRGRGNTVLGRAMPPGRPLDSAPSARPPLYARRCGTGRASPPSRVDLLGERLLAGAEGGVAAVDRPDVVPARDREGAPDAIWPLPSSVTRATTVLPTKNVTVPVGVPVSDGSRTVAVNVTTAPTLGIVAGFRSAFQVRPDGYGHGTNTSVCALRSDTTDARLVFCADMVRKVAGCDNNVCCPRNCCPAVASRPRRLGGRPARERG